MSGVCGIASDSDAMTNAVIHYGTPEWVALLDWLRFHGINPYRVLAGTRISRDACNRCIRYTRIVDGPDGQPLIVDGEVVAQETVEQGEAAPLPYPPEVQELLR